MSDFSTLELNVQGSQAISSLDKIEGSLYKTNRAVEILKNSLKSISQSIGLKFSFGESFNFSKITSDLNKKIGQFYSSNKLLELNIENKNAISSLNQIETSLNKTGTAALNLKNSLDSIDKNIELNLSLNDNLKNQSKLNEEIQNISDKNITIEPKVNGIPAIKSLNEIDKSLNETITISSKLNSTLNSINKNIDFNVSLKNKDVLNKELKNISDKNITIEPKVNNVSAIKNLNQINDSLNKIDVSSSKLKSSLNSINKNIDFNVSLRNKDVLDKELKNISNKNITIEPKVNGNPAIKSLNQIDTTLNKVNKSGNILYNTLKSIGLAIGFTKIIYDSLRLSNIMDALNRKMIKFFNNGKTASNSIKDLTNNFTLSDKSAKELLTTAAKFGSASGLSGDILTNFSTELSKLAADVAAFHAIDDVNSVLDRFGAATLGRTQGLREFGIAINTTSEAFKQQIIEIQKLTGATEQQARQIAILKTAQQQLAYTQGSAGAQVSSAWAQLNILFQNFKDILAKIGGIFSKIFAPVLATLNKFLTIPFVQYVTSWAVVLTTFYIAIKKLTTAINKLSTDISNSVFTRSNQYNTLIQKEKIYTNLLEQRRKILEKQAKISSERSLIENLKVAMKQPDFKFEQNKFGKKYIESLGEKWHGFTPIISSLNKRIDDLNKSFQVQSSEYKIVNGQINDFNKILINGFKDPLSELNKDIIMTAASLGLLPPNLSNLYYHLNLLSDTLNLTGATKNFILFKLALDNTFKSLTSNFEKTRDIIFGLFKTLTMSSGLTDSLTISFGGMLSVLKTGFINLMKTLYSAGKSFLTFLWEGLKSIPALLIHPISTIKDAFNSIAIVAQSSFATAIAAFAELASTIAAVVGVVVGAVAIIRDIVVVAKDLITGASNFEMLWTEKFYEGLKMVGTNIARYFGIEVYTALEEELSAQHLAAFREKAAQMNKEILNIIAEIVEFKELRKVQVPQDVIKVYEDQVKRFQEASKAAAEKAKNLGIDFDREMTMGEYEKLAPQVKEAFQAYLNSLKQLAAAEDKLKEERDKLAQANYDYAYSLQKIDNKLQKFIAENQYGYVNGEFKKMTDEGNIGLLNYQLQELQKRFKEVIDSNDINKLKTANEIQQQIIDKTIELSSIQLKKMEEERQQLIENLNAMIQLNKEAGGFQSTATQAVNANSVEAVQLESRRLMAPSDDALKIIANKQQEVVDIEKKIKEVIEQTKKELANKSDQQKEVLNQIAKKTGASNISVVTPL